MIKAVNELQDKLNPLVGHKFVYELPQIAVIGGQSAGKSSVLESFVGRDFLPRGSHLVTRRPLVLQLINNKNSTSSFGVFLHLSDKRFYDFDEIREEIIDETDRELENRFEISSKPINLKIYSPDVLDLTLVDLPGMTRVPVPGQPENIEKLIEDMIMGYIETDNCIILAVTAANQDLATSDALKLAKKADPEGKRTIGVLTKLDIMDPGTNARDILIGKHLPLKMGYIGVINRSQKDIEINKDMKTALADEQELFVRHPAYRDLSDRLGVSYLQTYLHKELSKHIYKLLPPLRDKFELELYETNERLERIKYPIIESDSDKERVLSETNEEFRKQFESSVGGKGWKVDIHELSGGAKINLILNDRFAKEINKMIYDENRMRREIATAIQNFFGVYLGLFTPDAAFRAVIENQIELFRIPSLLCVDWVTNEIENIINESVDKIKYFPNIRNIFSKITLNFVRECKKRCKEVVEHSVEAEKAYLNTNHEDFVRLSSFDNRKPVSETQHLVTQQLIHNKFDWICLNNSNYFWFVIKDGSLYLFRDTNEKDKIGSIVIKDSQLKSGKAAEELILFCPKKPKKISKSILDFDSNNEIKLTFTTKFDAEKWKRWLVEVGARPESGYNSNANSVSNLSINSYSEPITTSSEDIKTFPDYIKAPVDQVKRIVDSYVDILKKKFKDNLPKICTLELIDSTAQFIAVELRLRIRDEISSIDDILGGDPEEELRKDLMNRRLCYSDAIDIINKCVKLE